MKSNENDELFFYESKDIFPQKIFIIDIWCDPKYVSEFLFLDIPEPDHYWSFDQENVEDIKELKSSMQAIITGSSKSLLSILFTYNYSQKQPPEVFCKKRCS